MQDRRRSDAAPSSTAARSSHVSPSSAASEPRSCSDRNGSCWKSDSSQRSSASASAASPSARPSRAEQLRAPPAAERVEAVGSPGGCVAAIGSTARIPNGRQSSRSKRTGPGRDRARGREAYRGDGVGELGRRVRRLPRRLEPPLELEHAVAVDLAAEPGRQEALASGQWRASSPGAAARTRSPSPSSTYVTTEIPTSGATAA